MNVLKNRHGVYYVRKKVPKRLEQATAQVLGNGKPRQTFLMKSLGTKELAEAKRKAPSVLMQFDRVLAQAGVRIAERPLRTTLSELEITRIADHVFVATLANDERWRFGGREYQREAIAALNKQGIEVAPFIPTEHLPPFGIAEEQLRAATDDVDETLDHLRKRLAHGDITEVEDDLDRLLGHVGINLDRNTKAYRDLGMAALKAVVRAFEAIQQRNAGNTVDTPKPPALSADTPASGDTLRAAFTGWQKARNPSPRTLQEYQRAVDLFVQLHGDLAVADIKKRHAREFREALQDVPRKRTGELLDAPLPELARWGRENPEAPKVTATTVNKLFGGVQAISRWAYDHGVIPEDADWSDAFTRGRIKEDESDRAPFTTADLQMLFRAPVFTKGERPRGGKGVAAFWLPVLALFSGARLSELGGLLASNVLPEETTGHTVLTFSKDRGRGKRLKSKTAARIVPLHPELKRLGFLNYVAAVRRKGGEHAWLFPEVSPQSKGGAAAWSKWFGRYLRSSGITDTNKVFHSFRHSFKDALRAGGVPEDLNDALLGQSNRGSVGRGYGAKDIKQRFGMPALVKAVASVKYTGFNLSRLHSTTKGMG